MRQLINERPTIGVLAGSQVYYGTILGNFIGPLLHGVASAAESRQCNLLLACGMNSSSYTSSRPAWPVASPEADYVPVGPWNADGLIVINPLFSEARSQYIQGLIATGYPIVFAATGEHGPTVAIDNAGAIRPALTHLMAHGHRKIAFIAGYPDDRTGDSGIRLNAFRQATEQYGLAYDQRLIAYGSHGINGGQAAMQQILDTGIPFTAVLASNDESAIGAMSALKAAGLRIPEDVAIIGNDDTVEAVTQVPPLTTFHSSSFRMGYQALEMLLDFIEGRRSELESITIPTQFVVRQSCGCKTDVTSESIVSDSSMLVSTQGDSAVTSGLVNAMHEIVLAGTQRLSPDEVRSRCTQLTRAFIESLHSNNPAHFRASLEETLRRVEALEDDMYVWNAALSMLESQAGLIRESLSLPEDHQQPEAMVAEARAIIAQYLQRQHRHVIIHQIWIADRVGQLNARLLTALDEAHVYEILGSYLPQVGIEHIGVAFFKPKEDDPFAWCSLRKVSEQSVEIRFPCRQFPPKSLYEEPYRLVLLPMAGEETTPGFVVFDAADLEICAPIVWQLVTFLKVVRLYREATHGRQLAEEANRLKSRFLSTVSHELRTPLSLIVGLSEMLLQKGVAASVDIERDLKRIHASAQHLDGLIRDVLDLAQNEMGELKLVCTPLDLAEVLRVVATVGEQLTQDKGLEWQASIPADLPNVWGDRTRLRQVALNLVNNAVKFTEQGQVALRVSAAEEQVTVEIVDTGLGISPEDQSVIFDEFRQSERTTARGYGGLGLGLSICKRLVELHGGTIGVRSSGEEGMGSTFYFTLPAMNYETRLDASEPTRSRNVLVFAERSGSGELLRKHLLRQGFEVEMVWIDPHNSEMPPWLQSKPGAVVLEQGTAAEQVWDVMKALRENPLTSDIPILFYSLDGKQDRGSVFELSYLSKPLDQTELVGALERQQIGSAGQRAKTILIVDDEPGALELHARIVAGWSPECKILKARNGIEALKLMQEVPPDLILLDLMMPELDGFGLLEALRRDPRTRDIPVIVLTGQSLTLDDMQNLGRGVTSVLKKGLFSIQETLSHIEAALSHNTSLGSEARRTVRKAMAYIHEHYMQAISLEDTAHQVNVSKEHLARCFRQEMGITLVTYLNRYRVNQAKALLEKGELNLTEIALETGFSSSAYFSRVFRQETGMSPREYQRSAKPLR